MTITIELSPEIEAGLAAAAAVQGLSLRDYLKLLLEAQTPSHDMARLSAAERAAAWRASVEGLPHTPPLSDEAINRESIYGARG